MPRVAVVGGGIAGLAAADRIARLRPDVEVVLLEGADRIGGKLRRVRVAGAWVDVGAEAMLARRPEGVRAAAEAGLEVIAPLTTSALLRSRGANHPLPARTVVGVPSDLAAVRASGVLSAGALARIEAEPGGGPYPPVSEDVAVGELVAERFGDEVVDRLLDPLLGGVYAGRARELSLQAAVPALAARLAAEGGSLLAAAQAVAGAAAAGGTPAGDSSDGGSPAVAGAATAGGTSPASGAQTVDGTPVAPTPAPVFASVPGGLARLAEQLAAGGFQVRTGSAVRELRRTPDGFELAVGAVPDRQRLAADAVVLAVPAGKASVLLRGLAPVAAAELAGIETASMAIVTLAFAGSAPLPAGSGILVPAVEGLAIKGTTFSSQKWRGVGAEAGVTLLRASLGRAGDAEVLQREDAELVALVRRELTVLTGLNAEPVDSHVQRWGGGLPQYAVGHRQRVARILADVRRTPGLAVCGASYDGVGIPACIASAHRATDRVLAALPRSGQ